MSKGRGPNENIPDRHQPDPAAHVPPIELTEFTSGRTSDPSSIISVIPELRLYPDLVKKIEQAYLSSEKRLDIIFTDVDNTFIPGSGQSAEETKEGITSAEQLVQSIEPRAIVFIPITGSSWDTHTRTTMSVAHRLMSGEIPSYHHAIVTDGGLVAVGKDSQGEFTPDTDYEAYLTERKSRFNAEGVYDVAKFVRDMLNMRDYAEGDLKLTPVDFARIQEVDPDSPAERIFFQPHEHPHDRPEREKVCLYFYANSLTERDTIEAQFRDQLRSHSIVCCEEKDYMNAKKRSGQGEDTPSKFCLDITPVHKGTPIKYFHSLISRAAEALQHIHGGAPLEIHTWYCGDAANDLVAARRPEVDHVVMVGGSSQEFLRHADSLTSEAGKRVYRERDGSVKGSASIMKAILEDTVI